MNSQLPDYTWYVEPTTSKMANAKQCPHCSKSYGRAWTLARHIETQHGGVDKNNSSEEESIAEEPEASGEEDSSSEQSEEDEELHDVDIQRIRNLIAMAELGGHFSYQIHIDKFNRRQTRKAKY